MKLPTSRKEKVKLANILNTAGNLLILVALGILFFTLGPVALKEANYETKKVTKVTYTVGEPVSKKEVKLTPPNTSFSIIIPKIGAVAPVTADVDPTDEIAYKKALYRGVAHAKGTAFPGEIGNTYIFAHSTDAFYNVGRYNAVFYLLGKLTLGDEIDLYFRGERYIYKVNKVMVVDAKDVKYLGKIGEGSTLTLQTCYPPGTTLKRLVVLANLFKE